MIAGEKEKHQFEELSKKIIGAAINVHRALGPGFLESIYEEALKIELSEHRLHYYSQKEIKIKYLGLEVGLHRLDLLVENIIKLGKLPALPGDFRSLTFPGF